MVPTFLGFQGLDDTVLGCMKVSSSDYIYCLGVAETHTHELQKEALAQAEIGWLVDYLGASLAGSRGSGQVSVLPGEHHKFGYC